MTPKRRVLRRIALAFAGLLLCLLVALGLAIPLARVVMPDDLIKAAPAALLVIDNVQIVDVTAGVVLADRQLLVRSGRIEAVRPAASPVPSGYQQVDADGAFAAPGLFDMHVHAIDRKNLVLSLALGVTSVRNMSGYPMHLRWRSELERGEWLGSTLFAAAPTLNGPRGSNPFGHKVVTDPAAARERVRRYHAEGWDLIKAYARLDVDVYQAIIDEAARLDFPVAGHVPYPVVEADYGLAAAMVTLEHTEDIYQGPLDYKFADAALAQTLRRLKDMDATLTPTLMIFDHLTRIAVDRQVYLDAQPLEYLNPLRRWFSDQTSGKRWLTASDQLRDSLVRRNDYFAHITQRLHATGINLVVGSDWGAIYAVPGYATHEEMRLMRDAGIPDAAVLRMATINAARSLRVADRLGSIEVGKIADLILSEHNPLEDVTALADPSAVVKRGQWLNADALKQLKQSAANPSGFYLTFGRMLEFLLFA